MGTAKNKGGFRGAVGAPSLIMIFIIIALTAFATLSVVSANADRKLSAGAAEYTKQYYAADAEAEELYGEVFILGWRVYYDWEADGSQDFNQRLEKALTADKRWTFSLPEENETDAAIVSYAVAINDDSELQVSLLVERKENGITFTKIKWQARNSNELEYPGDILNLL
ncbi:MAG: hypothetical protein FWE80_08430 [Oscillospiraceae bacterium]|nr:hypothetical protein [Oscillospiraceae bacterium]